MMAPFSLCLYSFFLKEEQTVRKYNFKFNTHNIIDSVIILDYLTLVLYLLLKCLLMKSFHQALIH